MRVHDSAREHGIDPLDAVHAATWAVWVEDLDEGRLGATYTDLLG